MVSSDLEFTIHSSFLLMASLAQITASLVGMWVVAKGMTWDSHQVCLAGICYLAGLLAATVAGAMAAEVAGAQVFRNKEGLVRSEHACECGLLQHCIGDNPRFGPNPVRTWGSPQYRFVLLSTNMIWCVVRMLDNLGTVKCMCVYTRFGQLQQDLCELKATWKLRIAHSHHMYMSLRQMFCSDHSAFDINWIHWLVSNPSAILAFSVMLLSREVSSFRR